MRNVILVGEHELQRVLAGCQRNLGLGLSRAEMQVLEVVGGFDIQRRRRRVNDQVMVTAIGPVRTCRR